MHKDCFNLQIPSLNDVPLHHLTSGSLVRFRGMVQDTYDPEFFLGTYEVNRVKDGSTRLCTALYRDIISCAVNSVLMIFILAQSIYLSLFSYIRYKLNNHNLKSVYDSKSWSVFGV